MPLIAGSRGATANMMTTMVRRIPPVQYILRRGGDAWGANGMFSKSQFGRNFRLLLLEENSRRALAGTHHTCRVSRPTRHMTIHSAAKRDTVKVATPTVAMRVPSIFERENSVQSFATTAKIVLLL
jgi:hypothetical protein